MIKDFVIPINKDELLQSSRPDQYVVAEILPLRLLSQALDELRAALQTQGAYSIIEHFDTFFAILVHGNKVDLVVVMRAFNRVTKALEMLIQDMEQTIGHGTDLDEDERQKCLCVNKMLAYLFSSFACYIDEAVFKTSSVVYDGKRKKSAKTNDQEEWEMLREQALDHVYRWLALPLYKLWKPPIIEDEFVTLLTKVCYKILEQCKEAKQKPLRDTIFHILGTVIKKYNQITCVMRIIQLVRLHDVLATHIASGIILMVTECGCSGLIREVMKELDQTELGEADSRNVSIFLEHIATSQPGLIIPILDDVLDYLSSEHYSMRNCALGILAAVVEKALTGENLTKEQKEQRDECLITLKEHILDCNAYVRSKVLQLWQRLCCEGAIPIAHQGSLLAATVLRLEDKSSYVRKQALQLVRALLQSNPYAAKLNKEELSKSLEEEQEKLQQRRTEFASKSGRGDEQRFQIWSNLLPTIQSTINEVIEKNNDAEEEEDNDEADDEEINPDTVFEHIRQLMLNKKISEAVQCLWKVCTKLDQGPKLTNLSPEAKEECLFLLLLKTFMESENSSKSDDNIETAKSADIDQLRTEMDKQQRVVNYLRDCLKFAVELENAIPKARHLLFSTIASDAIEACTLLGTAYQFGVIGAEEGNREALLQVYHRDESVRNNIAQVYKEIYLKNKENDKSARQKALNCVKALIGLLKNLEPGQSAALTQLVVAWYTSEELSSEVLQILWEKFSMKSSDTDPIESRCALMLITILAQAEPGLITHNLDVLVKVGFGERAKTDLLLARDTCRALLKIKSDTNDIEKSPLRYLNDHEMFKEVLQLLKDNFANDVEDGYISFATDAINVVYHLANQPDHLMKDLLRNISKQGNFIRDEQSDKSTVPFYLLSRLLYVIGHITIKHIVYLDTAVYKELKRRESIKKLKKNKNSGTDGSNRRKSSVASTTASARKNLRNKEGSLSVEDNGEEAVEGAADDADAEFITGTLENHVVTGDGLLTKFLPLVLDICQHPDKYNDESVQASAALALSKMMTASSILCADKLQLLVTILERSPHPGIRGNVLIGMSDLTMRFPNQVEPWMKHVYARLRDSDVKVRRTCVQVLSTLITKEMVRVRGQISELALCIVDKDDQIRQNSKELFKELSQKGNALYNVIPDILSRLTDPELDLDEDHFHEILEYVLSLLQKEKQVDAIIDKICLRFKLATTERQWRDFAYCLSLLQFSGKSIRRLIESLPLLKDKIHNSHVLKALQNVIDQTKKKPNCKAACIELEEKLEELLKTTNNEEKSDSEIMPPPSVPKQKRASRRHRRKSSSEEEDDDCENDPDVASGPRAQENKKRRSQERTNAANSDSDSDNESSQFKTPTRRSKNAKHRKTVSNSPAVHLEPRSKRSQNKSSSKTPMRSSMRLSQSGIRH